MDDTLSADNTALQLKRYQALVEVLEVLSRASHSVTDVVGAIHEQATRVIDAQATVLALRQEDGWLCDLLQGSERRSWHVPFNEHGLSEQVYRHGPLRVNDVGEYLERHALIVRNVNEPGKPYSVRAYLGVPLDVDGRRAGILSLQSFHLKAFSELDLHFLELLGKHVSLALEHARLRERLEALAHTDELTGLPNRRAFQDLAGQAIARAERSGWPLSLAVIDVQGFKHINDTHGHASGDGVLRGLGAVLRGTLRAQDSVFRLGGDEFALLLEGDENVTLDVLRRLRDHLTTHPWPDGLSDVSINAGVAQWTPHETLDGLLRRADQRMYAAKAHGCLLLDEPGEPAKNDE